MPAPFPGESTAAAESRLIDSNHHLMRLEEFSFASIAKEAGVKERTVYRHFPTKTTLIESLCEWFQERIHYGEFAHTEAELLAKPEQIFPGFEQNEQLARAL